MVFSDHLVFQRDVEIPIWGWAEPGESVRVRLGPNQSAAVADSQGEWRVKLKPQGAGGPYQLEVEGRNRLVRNDIGVGEVWLCSGQSNMQWALESALDGPQEIAQARLPRMRLLTVENVTSPVILKEPPTSGWKEVTSDSLRGFSAVCYFFGKALHDELQVPIGLLNVSWGGSPIESWMSRQNLNRFSEYRPTLESLGKLTPTEIADLSRDYRRKVESREQELKKLIDANQKIRWEERALEVRSWKTMDLPASWEDRNFAGVDGVFWFRKEVRIPSSWVGQDLILALGSVDDQDTTWVNGVEVGHTQGWNVARRYPVPAAQVTSDQLEIAVRVVDLSGNGGINGEPESMALELPGKGRLSLAGNWAYQLGAGTEALPKDPELPPFGSHPFTPTALYNAMLAPLAPYPIRGVIWYQGESNVDQAYSYRELFTGLISEWRSLWGDKSLPFFHAQLANLGEVPPVPAESAWAELREAQSRALALPGTGQVVTLDIGDAKDIHPRNKREVGRRFSLLALKRVYGHEKVIASGPVYRSSKVEGNRVRVQFDLQGSKLAVRDGSELKGFAIAGADRKFIWANAQIEKDSIVVRSPRVRKPVAVRYAWADNPEGANLTNREGLPASPFRTDSWPGKTWPK